MSPQKLQYFLTTAQLCPYLPGRLMQNVITDPAVALGSSRFGGLLAKGFRRSGGYVYRPECPGCSACIPVRVPVAQFQPNRAQRRCQRANADLEVRVLRRPDLESHFALLRRYLDARHPNGGMDDMMPADYANMLSRRHCGVLLLEIYAQDQLVAVAVTDQTRGGLSAVYNFFAPELSARSLGTFAVLAQIAETQRRGLAHLYLGYWIHDSAKMAYKAHFQPCEGLLDGAWRTIKQE